MKQPSDKFTSDILGMKKRGRPAKAFSKSSAQRMRELRERQNFLSFDLRDIAQRKKDKSYSTYGEAFEDLLFDFLAMHDEFPEWFSEMFPDLFDE